MQPLNAIDAITPAFTRTHELLFKPFKLGRSWKLAATSYLAWASSFFFPYPLLLLLVPRFVKTPLGMPSGVLVALAIVPTVILAAILYCCVRLSLVDFEMVVTGAKMIAPMWRRYSQKVWPWLLTKASVSMISLGMLAPIIVMQVRDFIRIADTLPKPGDKTDPQTAMPMIAAIMGFYGTMLLLFFVPKFFGTLLDDFVLPFFVVEDRSVWNSVKRGVAVFAADPWNCLGYLAMKMVLGVVGYVMQSVALQVCMIPLLLVGVLAFTGGVAVFAHVGVLGHLLIIAAGVALGISLWVVMLYVSMLAFGYMLLLLDAYAIYFLAGRYPMLANLLEPGPGGPFAPPPVFPSAGDDDDEEGPDLPMNPAVA